MEVQPYTIAISDAELADLQSRLERTRWPAALTDGWERGTPVPYARRLAEYWRTRYDWRAAEARLNRLPPVPRRGRRSAHPRPPRAVDG